jgi:dienelactone hydrolase
VDTPQAVVLLGLASCLRHRRGIDDADQPSPSSSGSDTGQRLADQQGQPIPALTQAIEQGHISYVFQSPTIVFVAQKDDWTLPAACIKAKSTGAVTGAEFDVVEYKNAHHGFDLPLAAPIKYKVFTLAHSHDATIDSRKRFKEFFIKHLTAELKNAQPFVGKAK